MRVSVIPVDSEVWGRNVLSLTEIGPDDDLLAAEDVYVREHAPAYVSVRLAVEDLPTVHRVEQLGFSIVECQLQLLMRFKADYDVSRHGYEYKRVTLATELDDVLEIARTVIMHDRFSVDSGVPKEFSGRRYEAYVRHSFNSKNEEVWRLHDPKRDLTLGFRTHRRSSTDEALLLLGGITSGMQSLGLGVVSSHYCFNQLRRDGVRRAMTNISMINKPVFDLEVTHFGFRYQQCYAVLRKLYP